MPVWETTYTNYFSEENVESDKTNFAMVGVGCKGTFCDQVRTAHWIHVQVGNPIAWEEIEENVGMMTCPPNHVIARLRCIGESCALVQIQCAPVVGGILSTSGPQHSTGFFPVELHQTADKVCPDYHVLTGLMCANTNCGKKQLLCHEYVPENECVPTCGALKLHCGSDGCGGTCGTCESTETCFEHVGMCVSEHLDGTSWATSHSYFGTFASDSDMDWEAAVGAGMRCRGSYCADVKVILLGIHVDGTEVDESEWISDNTGGFFSWTDTATTLSAECPPGKAVSFVRCSGRYCNNLKFFCSKPYQWIIDQTGDPWHSEDWFSDEGYGIGECPHGYVMTGLECKSNEGPWCLVDCDSYCDSKKLRCRPIYPETLGEHNLGVMPPAVLASKGLVAYNISDAMFLSGAHRRNLLALPVFVWGVVLTVMVA